MLEGLKNYDFHVSADANQAYTVGVAEAYLRGLEGVDLARFLWLEQPLDRADWNGAQYLCGRAPVPIVLDECIYDEADVVRAKAIGARGVKLKLMKHFGMKETARLAHHARNLGLAVLFGNGVATDIGNLAEFLMLASSPDTFTQPCESSGFNKLKDHMLACLIETNGQFAMRQSAEQISRQLSSNVRRILTGVEADAPHATGP